MIEKRNVDIIIPVYNAFDFTKKCIETVIEHTNLKQNRLILINDKSPDERILPMLESFVEKYKELNIRLIDNEVNSGFVKTVNIGMKQSSENDVVLLNSDTEVTKNWLDKMRNVAYIRNNVASVTPLSNNATLASVPNFLEENELPTFMSLEEYAEEIEKCSFNRYPELTTGHGFCMYIKRDALNKVGFFDEITFEKGYGEENDFSYRCMKCGLTNLLCDNTFIYHKGTQSFSEEKNEFIKSHLKLLQDKHPENFDKNTFLCMNHPYQYVQENVKYNVNNHRKNVLILAHEFFKLEQKVVGGTVLHIHDIIKELKSEMNFHVVFEEHGKYRIRSFFEDSTSEIVLGKISTYNSIELYNHEYKILMEKVFKIIKVDFVHIHHLMHHYFDIIEMIKERQIPYIITLHDFYMVCPTFSLLENGEKYCAENKECDCTQCLKITRNFECNIIPEWRKVTHSVLADAKEVIVPSESTKEIINKYFNDIKIKVIEHGVEKAVYEEIIPEAANIEGSEELKTENKCDTEENVEIIQDIKEKNKINIAFIGGINKIKGLNFLEKFIEEANKENSKYNVHLFGAVNKDGLNESNGNYIYHGKYNREETTKILKENKIDIVLLLAIWPETYSYVLTEAVVAEIPVLALNMGAQEERINKHNLGWIIDKTSNFENILAKLDNIFENKEEYEEKIKSIKKYVTDLKTISEMNNEYREIYQKYLNFETKMEEKLTKDEMQSMFMYSQEILKHEKEKTKYEDELVEYHKTVVELKNEIDRLNIEIEKYQHIEEKYNHLLSSRKLQLLKKIKFIEF